MQGAVLVKMTLRNLRLCPVLGLLKAKEPSPKRNQVVDVIHSKPEPIEPNQIKKNL